MGLPACRRAAGALLSRLRARPCRRLQSHLADRAVRDVSSRHGSGLFGDGLAALSLDTAVTTVDIGDSRIESNERAGLSCVSALARLWGTTFDCNAFDLNGQTLAAAPAAIEDLGGNVCGCGEATQASVVLTSEIEPPDPMEGMEDL